MTLPAPNALLIDNLFKQLTKAGFEANAIKTAPTKLSCRRTTAFIRCSRKR